MVHFGNLLKSTFRNLIRIGGIKLELSNTYKLVKKLCFWFISPVRHTTSVNGGNTWHAKNGFANRMTSCSEMRILFALTSVQCSFRQFPKRWIQPEIVWDRPEVTQSSQVHHKKSFQPQTMYQIIDISTLWVIIMTHIKWIIMNREKYTEFTCTESWWVINQYPRVIMSHNDQWMNHDKNDE